MAAAGDPEIPADLILAFWKLAPERVAEATDQWLAFEEGNREGLPPLRRSMHTIKGEAHMLGLATTALLFERAEQVIDALIRREDCPPGVGDALLGAIELFGVFGASQSEEAGADSDAVEDVLHQLAAARDACTAAAGPVAKEGAPARPAAVPAPTREAPETKTSAQAIAVDEVQPLVAEMRRLAGEREIGEGDLREVLRGLHGLVQESARKNRGERDPVLVDLTRRVATLVAERSANEFAAGVLIERMEDLVQRASVVPVSRLEGQIHRSVRGLAQMLGKKVQVVVQGDAMLDAAVERRLGAALLHLLRNALDHGIETPEERTARGKPERGRIEVSIAQLESSVRVTVEDDGAGIDVERVRERLRATRPDADRLGEAALVAALFEHGMTTRDAANEISGRGVGLDVVANEVGAVGGRVAVETVAGRGTKFTLVMPATLRVDVAVPVTVEGAHFALPGRNVVEVVRIEEIVAGAEGPMLRRLSPAPADAVEAAVEAEGAAESGPLVPVRALAELLGLPARPPRPGDLAVILDHPSGAFAVVVDGYGAPRPISLVSARDRVFSSPVVSGVAPTPDGGTLVVLDAFALREVAGRHTPPRPSTVLPDAPRLPHVLVVEDSPVARELLSGVLRSFALRVSTAADGAAGLETARRDRPDLVLTDVEMPILDGLSMVELLRREPSLAEVPVLVLSDRTEPSMRARAEALGVRGFLAKQRFVEAELREWIERTIRRP